MERHPRHLHGENAPRHLRAGPGGPRCIAELLPGNRADRRGLDRFPVQSTIGFAGARHGTGDAAAASVGAGRMRPDHPARQPERQTLCPQRAGGEIELAFGFDLGPVVVRAEEFETLAEEVRTEDRALKFVREKITLYRRDIAKMIATGVEEAVPTGRAGQGRGDQIGPRHTYPVSKHC